MEISTVGASSVHLSYNGRSDVMDTVDSPPKFRASWPEAAFAIGGCGLDSALSAMEKSWLRLEYVGSTLAPPDLKSL